MSNPFELIDVRLNNIENLLLDIKQKKPEQENLTLLTRQQTAQILGISLPTLDDYTRNGIIPASRIGTRIRYKKADVYSALKEISTIKYGRKN